MKLIINTPKGCEYKSEANYISVFDYKNGSFGMLDNHVPIISVMEKGYIEVKNDTLTYIFLENAIIEQHNNTVNVCSSLISIGDTKESSFENFNEMVKERKKQNRDRNIELALAENELKKQIKKSGAGHI